MDAIVEKTWDQATGEASGSAMTSIPILLEGGWKGTVITDYRDHTRSIPPCLTLPGHDSWRTFLRQLVSDPSDLPGYAVLKYSRAGEVFKARCDAGPCPIDVICKQSRPVGFTKKLLQMGRPARERRNFHRGIMLWRAGIATARPLVYIECRKPQRRAWLITEFLPDVMDLHQWLLSEWSKKDRSSFYESKKTIIHEVAKLFVELQRLGWHHRDLKAPNLLRCIQPSPEGTSSIHLVDLDGLRRCRFWTAKRRCQPLVRLAASLQGHPAVTRSDLVRFLKVYLTQSAAPAAAWKLCFRALGRRVDRYLRRSIGRKHRKLDGYVGDRPLSPA